jgi:hypothetical protein
MLLALLNVCRYCLDTLLGGKVTWKPGTVSIFPGTISMALPDGFSSRVLTDDIQLLDSVIEVFFRQGSDIYFGPI